MNKEAVGRKVNIIIGCIMGSFLEPEIKKELIEFMREVEVKLEVAE